MKSLFSSTLPTTFRLVSAASTNATLVKSSPGMLHTVLIANTTAAVRYVKLYDKATTPTVGTDTPAATIAAPASTTLVVAPADLPFRSGIGFGITGAAGDGDTTAVAAGDIILTLVYS